MWLYPSNITVDLSDTNGGQTSEVVTEKHNRSQPLCADSSAELRIGGQVEISEKATLEDLKTQVENEGRVIESRS